MHTGNELNYKPACQAPMGQCSNCAVSYDCVRARSGRRFSWGVVFLGFLLAAAVIASLFG